MRLDEMADFICDKVNLTEDEDKTSAKGFLARRYEAIWNDQLWKDSLVDFTQTLASTGYTPAATWLPTKQVLLCPEIIDRVIGIRTGDRRLNVQSQEFYYRSDFDAFNQTGSVVEYFKMKPCVWEFDTAQDIFLERSSASDSKLIVTLDAVLGSVTSRLKPALTSSPDELGSYERIDSFSKKSSDGSVRIKAAGSCVVTNNTGFTTLFDMGPIADTLKGSGTAGLVSLADGESHTFTQAQLNTYLLAYANNTSVHPGGSFALGTDFNGTVVVGVGDAFVATDVGTAVTLAAEDTNAPRRVRVRLVGVPDNGTVVRVLGKAKCPGLADDSDEPVIQGIENCLLAFAQGDMLQKERQYNKANLCYTEAVALLERLKAIEVVQEANNKRFIPDDGYGNPYDLWSHPPLTF